MAATGFAAATTAIAGFSAWKSSKQKPTAPAVPTLPTPPPDVKADLITGQAAANAAAVAQRKRAAGANGRQSTILTGPQGIVGAPAPGKQTLLGL